MAADQARCHLGVAADSRLVFEPLPLPLPLFDTSRYELSASPASPASQTVAFDPAGDLGDVDPVEQRSGHPGEVLEHPVPRAAAALPVAGEPAAGARIHRRDQHDLRRIGHVVAGARDVDHAVLQRLAQHLEHVAPELGKFVEKQHPVVREGELARPSHRAAADQSRVGHGVVRRAEGPRGQSGPGPARSPRTE